jgi:pimeloyl-ACP methyl ester carboxylesterase
MRGLPLLVLLAACTPSASDRGADSTGSLSFESHLFVSAAGDTVSAGLAYLTVPANRQRAGGPTIRLAVVRLPSTGSNGNEPLVYLAGGPGLSGIANARGPRFPAFQALRAGGDVLLLDQRGTGLSRPVLDCTETVALPRDSVVTRELEVARFRAAAAACAERWRAGGVDLGGYNAEEIADDVADLSRALGAPRIALWGGSFGTHLALATLRRHPDLITRAILTGVVGPDDAWPLPGLIDRRAAGLAEPDVARLRALVARLDAAPATIRVPDPAGDTVTLVLSGYDLLGFVSGILPDRLGELPALLARLEAGGLEELARSVLRDRTPRPIGSAMAYTVSCASGMSAERRRRAAAQAAGSLLAPFGNLIEKNCDVWGARDLGETFRQPVRSELPVLLISGSADLVTPPEQAEAVLAGFPNGRHLIVEGAGHGVPLVTGSPEIIARMRDFRLGRPVASGRIPLGRPAP